MVDPSDEEVAALVAAGPETFVATRTARARALRAEGRREEAAALAGVRKPLRIVWQLVDVGRADPDLVARATTAAVDLEEAQAGRGGRVRAAMGALRTALDEVAEAAGGSAEVALAARQVLADPDSRQAWGEGRLLALPDPDTEGGISPAPAEEPAGEPPSPSPRRGAARRPTPRRRRSDDPATDDPRRSSAADHTTAARRAAEREAQEQEARARKEAQERAAHERAAREHELPVARAAHSVS